MDESTNGCVVFLFVGFNQFNYFTISCNVGLAPWIDNVSKKKKLKTYQKIRKRRKSAPYDR